MYTGDVMFSNHLLVRPDEEGGFDDLLLKDALREGRLYGVMEVMGYAQGFDYYLEHKGQNTAEMGSTVSLSEGAATLQIKMPQVIDIDPAKSAPDLTARLLVAVEGGFEEVTSDTKDIQWTVTEPGSYRAEIRMKPWHLEDFLGDELELVLSRDYVWVYSNPIFITP